MDLKVIITKMNYYKYFPKICTHRPSLSSKDEISRNKVNVMEIAFD